MSEWQPIETAPKDGTEVLLYCHRIPSWDRWLSGNVVIGAYSGAQIFYNGGWFSDSSATLEAGYESTGTYIVHEAIEPTHWMPLPQPPKE